MEFESHKAIYLQIADLLMTGILEKKWEVNERIPSVRELASMVEVNPNTVMRAYTFLQEKEVIGNKRGIGMYVLPQSVENIKQIKKEDFLQTDLPRLVKTLELLDMSFDELKLLLKNFTDPGLSD